MGYTIEEISFLSSNEINNVYGKIFIPDDTKHIRGIVQISHGMCEYIDRYDDFAKFLAENKYVVCGHSHVGHGKSIISKDNYGFFSKKDGYKFLIEDLYQMTQIIKKRFPKVPCYLLGHSMGSFIARCYASKYGNKIRGLLLSGTCGPKLMVDTGIQIANLVISRKGDKFRSRFINRIAIEIFNTNFKPVRTKLDWTSSDEKIIKEHLKDKMSSFIFTASGFKDLFYLVKNCNDIKCVSKIPVDLPIYIFSGDKDPVGENGEGVYRVYNMLKLAGVRDVTLKLYKNGRHEMLCEKNRKEVYDDVLDWLEVVRFGDE
jgi:alpha-beta hydrolase superfamily lysophospholipase